MAASGASSQHACSSSSSLSSSSSKPSTVEVILPQVLKDIVPPPKRVLDWFDVKRLSIYAEEKINARFFGYRDLQPPECIEGFSSDKETTCHLLLENWKAMIVRPGTIGRSIDPIDADRYPRLHAWLDDYFSQRDLEDTMHARHISSRGMVDYWNAAEGEGEEEEDDDDVEEIEVEYLEADADDDQGEDGDVVSFGGLAYIARKIRRPPTYNGHIEEEESESETE